jgi:hypothetical protein
MATYNAALGQWTDFCAEEGHDARVGNASPEQAAAFLAWLADSDSVTAGTIAGYKSGLRHHWLQATHHEDATRCPFTSDLVLATLSGIRRALAARDSAQRGSRPVTLSLGPIQLMQLAPYLNGARVASDEEAMLWAAATLGSYGLLRPNEFLGSYLLQDRKLYPHQIRFFDHLGQRIRPGFVGCPHRFEVALGATKADPLATNPPLVIRAKRAVEAMWRWFRRRHAFLAEDQLAPVFKLPGKKALTITALIQVLSVAMRRAGLMKEGEILTGRCFRRGGAADLVAAGASLEQIQAAGRWKSPAMVYTYTDPAVIQRREEAAAAGTASSLRPAAAAPFSLSTASA